MLSVYLQCLHRALAWSVLRVGECVSLSRWQLMKLRAVISILASWPQALVLELWLSLATEVTPTLFHFLTKSVFLGLRNL